MKWMFQLLLFNFKWNWIVSDVQNNYTTLKLKLIENPIKRLNSKKLPIIISYEKNDEIEKNIKLTLYFRINILYFRKCNFKL